MGWCVRQARWGCVLPYTFITSMDTASRGILARCKAASTAAGRRVSTVCACGLCAGAVWANSASSGALRAVAALRKKEVVSSMGAESTPRAQPADIDCASGRLTASAG